LLRKVGGSNPVHIKSKTEKLAAVASTIKGLEQGWLAQCQFKVVGIMFICGMLLPWLVFTIKGLEQGWLAQCQFKVVGIMFICDMVLPWLVFTI